MATQPLPPAPKPPKTDATKFEISQYIKELIEYQLFINKEINEHLKIFNAME